MLFIFELLWWEISFQYFVKVVDHHEWQCTDFHVHSSVWIWLVIYIYFNWESLWHLASLQWLFVQAPSYWRLWCWQVMSSSEICCKLFIILIHVILISTIFHYCLVLRWYIVLYPSHSMACYAFLLFYKNVYFDVVELPEYICMKYCQETVYQ